MADRFLRAKSDGHVYVWTEYLAKWRKDDFEECDKDGRLVRRDVEFAEEPKKEGEPTVIPRKNKGGRPSKAQIQAAIAAPLKVDTVEDIDPATLKT